MAKNGLHTLFQNSSTLDVLFYLSMALIVARTTGVVCLIGIGLGFGLSSWIVYKVYHRAKRWRKRRRDSYSDDQSEDSPTPVDRSDSQPPNKKVSLPLLHSFIG